MTNSNITLRNALTDARITVEIKSGRTVHDLVVDSGFVAPEGIFRVRDKNGEIVDTDLASDHPNTVLTVGLPGEGITGGGGPELLLILSATFLPGVAAFFTQIGNKLGKSAADRITDIKLWRRGGGIRAEIITTDEHTVIDIPENLSDEARIALIELDISDPKVRGKRLYWDGRSWCPERP
jgi:hypothetical protein